VPLNVNLEEIDFDDIIRQVVQRPNLFSNIAPPMTHRLCHIIASRIVRWRMEFRPPLAITQPIWMAPYLAEPFDTNRLRQVSARGWIGFKRDCTSVPAYDAGSYECEESKAGSNN
jgi:hypothetical protein